MSAATGPDLALAEAAVQLVTAFPDAAVDVDQDDPAVQAAIWTARMWGTRRGWACLAIGHGGHYPPGGAYTFTRFAERWYRWPDQRTRLLREALAAAPAADV